MKLIKDLVYFGEVKDKYYITTCGRVITNSSNSKSIFLSHGVNKKGYHQVVLYKEDGTKVRPYVHKLVALAYMENPLGLDQVDHIDNIKEHNYIGNLQWIGNYENHLKMLSIDKTSRAKLTDEEVIEMRKLFESECLSYLDFFKKYKEKYKVSEKSMRYAIQGKSYFWIK